MNHLVGTFAIMMVIMVPLKLKAAAKPLPLPKLVIEWRRSIACEKVDTHGHATPLDGRLSYVPMYLMGLGLVANYALEDTGGVQHRRKSASRDKCPV